jgi:predicted small secreted protein
MKPRSLVMNVVFLAPVVLGALVIPACNTTAGMGRDLSSVGHGMENAANKNR